jgi:hypothetical protein
MAVAMKQKALRSDSWNPHPPQRWGGCQRSSLSGKLPEKLFEKWFEKLILCASRTQNQLLKQFLSLNPANENQELQITANIFNDSIPQ